MRAQWVNLEVPINCVLLKHWNKYIFPFWRHSARAQWVNLEVPINCVILEHWNNIFSLFGGYSMRAQWVNLEVPINCVLLEHWNKYIFPFWVTLLPMGKFGSPHKLCIIRTLE